MSSEKHKEVGLNRQVTKSEGVLHIRVDAMEEQLAHSNTTLISINEKLNNNQYSGQGIDLKLAMSTLVGAVILFASIFTGISWTINSALEPIKTQLVIVDKYMEANTQAIDELMSYIFKKLNVQAKLQLSAERDEQHWSEIKSLEKKINDLQDQFRELLLNKKKP